MLKILGQPSHPCAILEWYYARRMASETLPMCTKRYGTNTTSQVFKQSFGITHVSNAVQTELFLMPAVGVKGHTYILSAITEQTRKQCRNRSASPTYGRPYVYPSCTTVTYYAT